MANCENKENQPSKIDLTKYNYFDTFFRFYNYLLLDVSKFGGKSVEEIKLEEFMAAIFVVGKGRYHDLINNFYEAKFNVDRSQPTDKDIKIHRLLNGQGIAYVRTFYTTDEKICSDIQSQMAWDVIRRNPSICIQKMFELFKSEKVELMTIDKISDDSIEMYKNFFVNK